MPAAAVTGFYGKLPCRGDFIQRRVPQEFVDPWDAWLQQCLYASRQQLGEGWLEAYLTSPIWRFVLAGGICGETPYAGVMLASVDRVGRYFPLTLICPLEPGGCLVEAACEGGRLWFEAAEALALKALDASDLDVQGFDAEVDALAGLGASAQLAQSGELMEQLHSGGFARSGAPWHLPMLGETPQRALNAFASIELQRAFRPCALWWTQGSQALQPGCLVTSGLPPPSAFTAMLSGQWRQSGWNSIELASPLQPQVPEAAVAQEAAYPQPVDVRIAAAHPPLRRGADAAAEPRYILRPDTGLWGLVVPAGTADSGASADLIADVAQGLAPQATLTARIEAARRALGAALASRGGAGAAFILLLAERNECALLWSGSIRAVRIRGGEAVQRVAGEGDTRALTAASAPAPQPLAGTLGGIGDEADAGGLLALLAAPAAPLPALRGHYDDLDSEDLWVLAGSEIPQTLVRQLAGMPPGALPGFDDSEPAAPLLLLAAQLTDPTLS